MNKRVILWVAVFVAAFVVFCLLLTRTSNAASFTVNDNHNYGKAKDYNCAVISKPSKPDWVWYRYPTVKKPKREAYNNGEVELIWEDSYRAHKIEIKYRMAGTKKWKEKFTDDDGSKTIKGLQNGKFYEFKVRGVSNCGKSSWQESTKTGKIRP